MRRCALTGDDGTVVFRTIRPPHYGPRYEAEAEPAHVHFDIETDGYRPFHWEIWFEDDPRIIDGMRDESAPPIATVRRAADGAWEADVSIPLQPIG